MKTEALIHELSVQGRPVRRVERPFVGFLRWALLAALCVGIGIAAFGPRSDVASAFRNPTSLSIAILTMALGASSALSAFMMSVPDRARPWLDAVPVAILALALAVLGHAFVTADSVRAGYGITCVAKILTLALLPSALLYLRLRRAAPLDVGRVGLMAALSAMSLGVLGSRFICHDDDPLHILIWHYLPMMSLGGAGVLLGRLLLRWDGR